jgi:hypothetical protein
MEEYTQDIIAELVDDNENVTPIDLGGGLIAYRKYIWAIKLTEESLAKLESYKTDVIAKIDNAINNKRRTVAHLKDEIQRAMLADPAVDKTKNDGRTLSLPDVATVSISKLQDKLEILDQKAVLKALGKSFEIVKVSLDTTRAKKAILEGEIVPEEAIEKRQSRTLSIRYK